MKEKKNDHRVSVKELAELIGVSTDTVRRAFRKGEIPAIRIGTALRFDFDEVRRCMQRKAEAIYGIRRRAARAGRAQSHQPPPCKTGALFPGDAICVFSID